MAQGDLFYRTIVKPEAPITADKCYLQWGDTVAAATQVTIQFQQQINRRRTVGNKKTVIWGSSPQGQINVQRLLVPGDAQAIFAKEGWDSCTPTTMSVVLAGCEGKAGPVLQATGCVVSSYQVQAEAESLTVMDNIVIDFLQLENLGG